MMNKELLVKILKNAAEIMNSNDFDEYEIVRMGGYDQNNPHHVYDLWGAYEEYSNRSVKIRLL